MIWGAERLAQEAVGVISNLAQNGRNSDVICEEGGIQALITVLQNGCQGARAHAARGLLFLAEHSKTQGIIQKEGGIQALNEVLQKGCQEARVHAERALERLAAGMQQSEGISG